jgi:glycosyltransferase involved in cell wall biosynthesis
MHDLLHLGRGVRDVYSSKELEDKFQFIMCGFDTRGTITEITPDQQRHTRNIRPEETIWMKFESVFTNKYEGLRKDPEYVTWLKKIKREEYPDMDNKTYIRRWTLPLTKYGEHYDSCDVCLAPLEEDDYTKTDKGQVIKELNLFNEVKSELKIIEAGMKRKVLIAQDCGIYRELLENGKTGILIKNDRKDWYRAMKKVILDKEYRDMLADNLHEYVMAKYELKTVTAHRVKIYKQVIEEMKAKRAMASKTVIPIESKTEEIA